MNYTLQVFILDTKKQELNRNCEQCQVEFTVKNQSNKKRFCSLQCVGKAKRKDHTCIGCGKTFQNYQERHLNRMNPKFCNRECYHENQSRFNKPKYRYDKFYYCDYCSSWIPKQDSIMFKGKPCCPKKSCSNVFSLFLVLSYPLILFLYKQLYPIISILCKQ